MKMFLMFVFCLVSSLARAETIDPKLMKVDLCGPAYEVWHVNGIFTSRVGAQANLVTLSQRYGNAHEGHWIRYNLAYNQTNGMLDLVDSFKQVALAFPGVKYSDWLYAVWTGVLTPGMTADMVKTVANMIAYDIDRPSPYQDADLLSIENQIVTQHVKGARMLIVGHSQGTLYANLIYDRLIKHATKPVNAASMGLVFVAAATSSIRGGGSYFTGTNDVVINTVRLLGDKNTLPGQYGNPYVPDGIGHNLIAVYLNPLNAGTVGIIQNLMYKGLNKLKGSTGLSQRRPQTYPHAGVQWNNCGPGSGNPYNCWYDGPNGRELKVVPYYTFSKIAVEMGPVYSNESVAVDGSLAAAESAARTQAMQCQSVAAAEYNRQKLAGTQQPYFWVRGCFPYFGAPGPTEAMWADDMVLRVYRYPDAWISQYSMYRVGVSGYVDGVCRLI